METYSTKHINVMDFCNLLAYHIYGHLYKDCPNDKIDPDLFADKCFRPIHDVINKHYTEKGIYFFLFLKTFHLINIFSSNKKEFDDKDKDFLVLTVQEFIADCAINRDERLPNSVYSQKIVSTFKKFAYKPTYHNHCRYRF